MAERTEQRVSPAEWALLIEAVAVSRDRAAFARLFDHFAPRIKAYMRRAGASDGMAEDLAQETMLSVWRKADRFDPATAGASTWIFTIARNLRIDALRRQMRHTTGSAQISADHDLLVDGAPLPDDRVTATQMETRVRAAMTGLSAEQARVVELSFFEDRPHGEIAKVLDLPLGTVKSRLRLAMNKLRGLLDEAK